MKLSGEKIFISVAVILSLASFVQEASGSKILIPRTTTDGGEEEKHDETTNKYWRYEVWGSDQSNSVPSESSKGANGSYLWIWDSKAIKGQINGLGDAVPLSCTPEKDVGPCDLHDVFPRDLFEYDIDGNPTTSTLGDLDNFGRLHGMLRDPQHKYVTANIFAPGGGYVGVIDTKSKEAVGLFRVTKISHSSGASVTRSVHMSFWTEDGSAIIVANLHGKAIERIDVTRDPEEKITALSFNSNASIGLGKGMSIASEATYFLGNNAFNRPLIGSITGDYSMADFGDLTPNMVCKESGCGIKDPMGGARPNNVPICPIPSSKNNGYVTLGGGGLLVLKLNTTPMQIVGEYGNSVINGAGCGGAQVSNQMFLNGGVSASSAGHDQSTFTVYSLDDTKFTTRSMPENTPMPIQVYKDSTNTNTLGNLEGSNVPNPTGQIPGTTSRRDSHGVVATLDGNYIHVVDRIRNVVEVFDTTTYQRTTYDLVSRDGKSGREGPAGACFTRSVLDDGNLALNDPAPDLLDITPDGKYLMIAFRGPAPVSVSHSAQGSCPGVGIVKITQKGKKGRLVDVLRTTNTVDTSPVGTIIGGQDYAGAEYSDVHSATVVYK